MLYRRPIRKVFWGSFLKFKKNRRKKTPIHLKGLLGLFHAVLVRVAKGASLTAAGYPDGGKLTFASAVIVFAFGYVANDAVVKIIHKIPPK